MRIILILSLFRNGTYLRTLKNVTCGDRADGLNHFKFFTNLTDFELLQYNVACGSGESENLPVCGNLC
jgi:hypothetical protein